MQAKILAQQYEREKKIVMQAITLSLVLHIVFFTIFVILPEFKGSRPSDLNTIYIEFSGGGGEPGPAVTTPATDAPATDGNTGSQPVELHPNTTKPDKPADNIYIPPPADTTPTPSDYGTVKPETNDKPADTVTTTDNVKNFAPQFTKNQNATQKVEQIQRELQRDQQNSQQAAQQAATAVSNNQSGTESVNSAIQQLRDKQAAQQAGNGAGGSGGGSGGGNGPGHGPGSGPGIGTGTSGPLGIYLGLIVPIIEKNWSFSPTLFKGTPDMEVILEVTIQASGEITDIKFAKKSGDTYLDESAYRAMSKSSPLPAFGSSGIKERSITMQFRFTPKGLKRSR